MQVREVMSTNFKIIAPTATVQEAAEYMRDLNCGYLPVGENDRLKGSITDRDIVIRAVAAGHHPGDVTVDAFMTEKIIYCFEDDNLEAATAHMKKQRIRRLVVLNHDKRMTGILSLGDIARASNDNDLTGDVETALAQVP